ncbi:MAG: tRNA (guanosine(46)-N7)-methyltransferase TrmB [Burkholderiales bacterium]|nr:tRNA (guanosine(46)-N7)-methyltransferase TrmB [Burkholderiales bacterium]
MTEDAPPRLTTRSIRSFVLRQGRMSPAQERAFEAGMARFGIAFADTPLDTAAAFGRAAPVVVEIGFGMGETTARIAQENPGTSFLGIEVHAPGVGALLKRVIDEGLANVRVIRHDAVEVFERMLMPDSLAGVHLFFPDPWPKARHHKRRIVQPDFVHLVASRLAPGACLHCATDWEPYALHMLEVLAAEPLLENTAADFAPRPRLRPQTKFEARGLKLGHAVRDVIFRRRLPP